MIFGQICNLQIKKMETVEKQIKSKLNCKFKKICNLWFKKCFTIFDKYCFINETLIFLVADDSQLFGVADMYFLKIISIFLSCKYDFCQSRWHSIFVVANVHFLQITINFFLSRKYVFFCNADNTQFFQMKICVFFVSMHISLHFLSWECVFCIFFFLFFCRLHFIFWSCKWVCFLAMQMTFSLF